MNYKARIIINNKLVDIYGDDNCSLESMKRFLEPFLSEGSFVKTGEEGNLIYNVEDDGTLLDRLTSLNSMVGAVAHDYRTNIFYINPFKEYSSRTDDAHIKRIYNVWVNKSAVRRAAFGAYHKFRDDIFNYIVNNLPKDRMSDEDLKSFIKRTSATMGGMLMNVNIVKDQRLGTYSQLNEIRETTEL